MVPGLSTAACRTSSLTMAVSPPAFPRCPVPPASLWRCRRRPSPAAPSDCSSAGRTQTRRASHATPRRRRPPARPRRACPATCPRGAMSLPHGAAATSAQLSRAACGSFATSAKTMCRGISDRLGLVCVHRNYKLLK